MVQQTIGGVGRLGDLGGAKTAVSVGDEDMRCVELDGETWAIKQGLYRSGVQHVECPSSVGGFDKISFAELSGFKINVVESEKLSDFIEESLGSNQ